MNEATNPQRAVELLQELGLKEYQAKSFVALSRLPHGTAKEISEISDVPRTRVYDAVQVLEEKGLVEIQTTTPKQFRAVPIAEAAETLRKEYNARIESLETKLSGIESVSSEEEHVVTNDVWALGDETAISNRTEQLIDDANEELVFIVGHDDVLTDHLIDRIKTAMDRGVSVVVGAISDRLRERIEDELPDATVFVSGLAWLQGGDEISNGTEISRLLLVDRQTILVSSFQPGSSGGLTHEQAVFGRGFDNGIVTITRRLMATGLIPGQDPDE